MKPFVKFGLLSGGIGVLFTLMMYVTELNRSSSMQAIQWFALIIPIACMYFAINTYKTEIGNGWISFGTAFKQAFYVGCIGGIIGSVFHFIYVRFIDPAFIDFQKLQQFDKMTEDGMSDSMIETAMEQSAPFMTPSMQFVFGLIISLFFAAVLGLLMAAIFKKQNPDEIA